MGSGITQFHRNTNLFLRNERKGTNDMKGKHPFLILLCLGIFLLLWGYLLQDGSTEKQHPPQKFGATYMTMDNPFFVALNDRIKEEIESNGDVLITRDPAKNQEKQNQQILDMIDAGVVAIFVNPVDWAAITPALVACQEAGIPVFDVDTYVYDSAYVVSSILSDNYDAGVQIARDVMKKRSRARIVIIYESVVNSTGLRVQGFLDTMEGHDEYQIVIRHDAVTTLEAAMECMKEIIDNGTTFDVVLGGNDPTALGILAAIQMKRVEGDILIYGVDGSPDGKAMIQSGLLEGSSAQFPYLMGKTACDVAYAYLAGEAVEEEIFIPVRLITKNTLDQYNLNGWQ